MTERQTEIERDRERQTEREREIENDRERQRETHGDRERERARASERERERAREREREREIEISSDIYSTENSTICVAVWRGAQQYVAACCSVLQRVAACCSVLRMILRHNKRVVAAKASSRAANPLYNLRRRRQHKHRVD